MSTISGADKQETGPGRQAEFQRESLEKRSGLIAEYLEFLGQSKKWWLLPVLILILLVGLLIFLGGTVLAPFIYPLF